MIKVLPKTEEILRQMGEQIRLARLRRKLSTKLVAERAGITRATLLKVEKGSPSVAMGIYASVLHALNNLDKDLLLIAKDDELCRKLMDLDLITKKRAPKRRWYVLSEKIIYVYENWTKAEPNMIGKLYVSSEKGKEHYSFEYDEKWLTESYFSSI